MIIETTAYARAGLIGNPSDGYFGKTVAFAFRNFQCTVTLFESPELRIEPAYNDRSHFTDIEDLQQSVNLTGYYGGMRLVKAAIICFGRYLDATGGGQLDRNFTIRYDTTIPQRVGLAGSSAIITAVFRALAGFFEVTIPWPVLANLVLETETRELGIPAGLQDRVAQTYEGLVYMDFSRAILEDYGHGRYEYLDAEQLPPLFVAYGDALAQGTEVAHSGLRARFERGERRVHRAMQRFAALTDDFRRALGRGDNDEMHRLIDQNFDLRASILPISEANWALINAARNVGAAAKFAGSGGAIVGTYSGARMYTNLQAAMKRIGATVLQPELAPPHPPPPPVPEEDSP